MGLFNKLFAKEQTKNMPKVDLSVLKTDVHSHLLPGIDDGVKTLEESVETIRGLADLGYKKLITTPHTMSDYYPNTSEIILEKLELVRNAVAEAGISITIEAASEYYLDYELREKIGKEKLLTFRNNSLLFELSFYSPTESLDQTIFEFQIGRYNLVLAHPERYSYWHKDLDYLKKIHDKGVQFQINLLSLAGHYSQDVKKMAITLIKNDLVDYIGTDCHGPRHLEVIERALTTPELHDLLNSGKLQNKFL
jgi:protein-tyrosine phosphatase